MYKEETYEPLSTVNVALAAYTTVQARLKLYSYLEKFGDRVLYYDTDSAIYISKPNRFNVKNILRTREHEVVTKEIIKIFRVNFGKCRRTSGYDYVLSTYKRSKPLI